MTAQAPASETATTSSESGGYVGVQHRGHQHVARARGRARCRPRPAPRRASWSCVPARKSSSKWLGVRMSACGTTVSRMNSGIPGRTNMPAADVAHHRVAAVDRGRVGRLHRRDGVEDHRADRRVALVAGQHRVALGRAPRGRRSRRSPRGRRPGRAAGRATRRTRCGWRSARSAPARPRGRAAAAGRPPPSSRRGRRPPRTGSTGSSRAHSAAAGRTRHLPVRQKLEQLQFCPCHCSSLPSEVPWRRRRTPTRPTTSWSVPAAPGPRSPAGWPSPAPA